MVIFLSGFFDSEAQNYNCFTPGITRYFINSDGYVRGMRIDSITGSGNNFVYHPYRTTRGGIDLQAQISPQLDSTGGSWLGEKVFKQPNGDFLFDNLFGDTVIIKSRCNIGDAWLFYTDSTAIEYTATCVSRDTITIMGFIDSIKTIRISCNDTTDPIHNFELVLSKSNGFYRVFDLYTFPYRAQGGPWYVFDYFLHKALKNDIPIYTNMPTVSNSIFTLFSFPNPTYADIYNFEPGDVTFSCNYGSSQNPLAPDGTPLRYILDTIIGKNITTAGIEYQVKGTEWRLAAPPTLQFGEYTYSKYSHTYTFIQTLDKLLEKMPEEGASPYILFYSPKDTVFCMESELYNVQNTNILDGTFFYTYYMSSSFYKTNIGAIYVSGYSGGQDHLYEDKVLYYKRGNIECGHIRPITLVGILDREKEDNINIYPNPANDVLCIELAGSKFDIGCYDALGKKVFTQWAQNKVIVPTLSLHPGVYHLVIRTDEGEVFTKKLLIQR